MIEIDVEDNQEISDEEKLKKILDIAFTGGLTSGQHHKQWALDQIVRIISGDNYDQVIKELTSDVEDYDWFTGIAP